MVLLYCFVDLLTHQQASLGVNPCTHTPIQLLWQDLNKKTVSITYVLVIKNEVSL